MTSIALVFDVIGRDNASKTFDKVGDSAEKAGKKGHGFGKIMAGVAAAGVASLGAALKTGFGEVKDYQAGLADLNNVIKTTHGAAGLTADQMEALATKIEGYSGQTDDSIVKSEGLLATFTNIRDAAGKNNDIFSQATMLTADMAQKFGGDASGAAIQLGKALNDPTKGLTSLSKIGVSFTEEQKKSIKTMQAHGDMAGAQKVILAELSKEVGGSAKAYGETLPGQVDRAKRSFEGASQQLVTAMLPAITGLMKIITEKLLPAFSKATEFVSKHMSVIGPLVAVVGTLVAGIKLWTISQAALNVVMALNPIGLVVIGIAALAAGLVIAYKRSETFRNVVKGAFEAVSTAASFMWDKVIRPVFKFIVDAWLAVAGAIVHGAATAFGWVPGIGGKLKNAAKEFDKFKDEVNASLDGVKKNLHITIDAYFKSYGKDALGVATNAAAHGRWTGGPVSKGMPYMVGERGPELFMPSVSGQILNQSQMRGMGRLGAGQAAGGSDPEALSLLREQNKLLRQLVATGPDRTGQAVGQALDGVASRSSRAGGARVAR